MPNHLAFPLRNFENQCANLKRVGIDPGYVMYTNHHAGNNRPAARLLSSEHLDAAIAYIDAPSDENFMALVKAGVLFDTEWDHLTKHWKIVSFEGWEVLHKAFSHLHFKATQAMTELTGISDTEFNDLT
ncbi:MAG: hypothetical protein ACU836_12420 [Gammaproteobacteria bacterium]